MMSTEVELSRKLLTVYNGGWRLRPEVYEWMLENVGDASNDFVIGNNCPWMLFDNRVMYLGRATPTSTIIIKVRDPDKALLLKLTWGGK